MIRIFKKSSVNCKWALRGAEKYADIERSSEDHVRKDQA